MTIKNAFKTVFTASSIKSFFVLYLLSIPFGLYEIIDVPVKYFWFIEIPIIILSYYIHCYIYLLIHNLLHQQTQDERIFPKFDFQPIKLMLKKNSSFNNIITNFGTVRIVLWIRVIK